MYRFHLLVRKLFAQSSELLKPGFEPLAIRTAAFVIFILCSILLTLQFVPFQTLGSLAGSENLNNINRLINPVNANSLEILDVSATTDFRLEIPKVAVNMSVAENVDPVNEAIYGPVIERKIAHGKYTRLPDEAKIDGNVYLFAHRDGYVNGNYVGFFSRLDELNVGDEAVITYAGEKYGYVFLRNFVIAPHEVWVYNGESQSPMLSLQTCENGESQRLIVQFALKSVSK